MKIVYVYIETNGTKFIEMLGLSILSLLMYNDYPIYILTNEQSYSNIPQHIQDKVRIIVVDTTQQEDRIASRAIKTNIFQYISGDFLYLDCDTIVLNKINHSPANIDMVYDWNKKYLLLKENCDYFKHIVPKTLRLTLFNSGVIFVKDTETTRALYQLWNQLWCKSLHEYGLYRDQQPLQHAFEILNIAPIVLNSQYNFQCSRCKDRLKDIVILHPYSKNYNTDLYKQLLDSAYKNDIQTLNVLLDEIRNFYID